MPPRGRGGRMRAGSPLRRTLKALQEEDAKEQARVAAKLAAGKSSVKSELIKVEALLGPSGKAAEWTSKVYPALPDTLELPRIQLPLSNEERQDVATLRSIRDEVRTAQWFLTSDPDPPKYWTAVEINAARLRLDKPSVWSSSASVPEKAFPRELRAGRKFRALAKSKRRSLIRGSNLVTKEELDLEDAEDAEDEASDEDGIEGDGDDGEKLADDDGDYGAGGTFDDDDGYDDMDSGAEEAVL